MLTAYAMQPICNSVYSPLFGINKTKNFDYTKSRTHTNKREIKPYFINHGTLHKH